MTMNNTQVFDKDLNPVLEVASADDLTPYVGYIKDKISEDLTISNVYKKYSPDHTQYADLIAREIRDMGGNSFANIFRGEGPEYHEIVCDVADKVGASYNKNRDVETIENAILEKILEKALEKMSDDEKAKLMEAMGGKAGFNKGGLSNAAFIAIFKAGGFYSYQLTVIIANQVAKAILGKGLSFAANRTITQVAAVLTGPIGWAISGIWAAIDIAGPAYKVTIPCVIHTAMLRKKYNAQNCSSCGAQIPDTTAKFCTECGNKLG